MNSEIFATLSPTKLFFRCAIPAVVTSVFGALYSVIDGIFVGRFLGESALAAVNLIMPVILIVESLSNMIATGASVNISMLLGEGRCVEASRVFSFAVKFIITFSCIIGAVGFFFAENFITLIAPGANAEAIAMSVQYLKVYCVFSPLVPIYFAMDNFLRVCGRQKTSMVINIVSQVMNVVLDFVFIVVLHKGVREAAIASCVAIAVCSAVMLAMFVGKRMDVYYTAKNIPAARFFRICFNGASEFFSGIAVSVMSIIMNLFLLKYGGTTAVAAFSIVMYVDSIIGMMNFGVCDSMQPAISYCYGAGKLDRMKALFRRVLIATIIISAVAFLFMLLAGPYAARIFIKPEDTELLQVSLVAVKIFAFSYLVGWIDNCFSSYFTALGRAGRSLLISLFGTLVFPVIYLFILTAIWGLNGVWLMAPVSGATSGVLTLILAKTLKLEPPTPEQAKELMESAEND